MAKDKTIDLAKKDKSTKKKVTKKKPVAKKKPVKKVEPVLTPDQQRDLKAKAKVEELLEDSPIVTLNKTDDELIELETTPEEPKGVEWLEEQITLLTEKNAALTNQMDVVKVDFEKVLLENQQLKTNGVPNNVANIANDGDVKKVVFQLFNELQENHIKLGVDNKGVGNFRIYCPGFLNRMIKFFPFLEEAKRYQ